MTTHKPRVNNLPKCLESLRNQTLKADKIVFTLSRKDFTEEELPDALKADDIEIQWIEDDIKVWKKLAVMFDLYPEDEIINCDDDVYYQPNFVEQLHNKHIQTGMPVSPDDANYRGLVHHNGYASLVKAEYFKGYRPTKEVIDNVIAADIWYSFIVYMNGYRYVRCTECFDKRTMLPTPSPYTASHINKVSDEWKWLQNYYNFYKY